MKHNLFKLEREVERLRKIEREEREKAAFLFAVDCWRAYFFSPRDAQ